MKRLLIRSVVLVTAVGCSRRSGDRVPNSVPVAAADASPSASSPADAGGDAAAMTVAASPGSPARCGPGAGPPLDAGRTVRSAMALDDGSVLLSGGSKKGVAWTSVMDPATGVLVAVDLPGNVVADRLLALPDGTVLALGHVLGTTDWRPTIAARLDAARTGWTTLPAPPACLTDDTANLRDEHQLTVELALLPRGEVLAVGHRCAAILGTSSSWSVAATPPAQRRAFTLTVLPGGDVLRIGGLVTMADDFDLDPTAAVERFDVKTRRWRRAAAMRYTRHNHTATLLPTRKVVVIGGCEGSGPVCNGEGPSPPVEIYDSVSDRWKVLGEAPITDRWNHTATSLRDGRVVVLGGFASPDEFSVRPTAVLDGDRWFEGPSLGQWRGAHQAVVLGDRVLIAGPMNTAGAPLVWYGLAPDCSTSPVKLGPAHAPDAVPGP